MYLRIRNKYRETCGGVVVGDSNTFATDSEYYSSPVIVGFILTSTNTHIQTYIYILYLYFIIPAYRNLRFTIAWQTYHNGVVSHDDCLFSKRPRLQLTAISVNTILYTISSYRSCR